MPDIVPAAAPVTAAASLTQPISLPSAISASASSALERVLAQENVRRGKVAVTAGPGGVEGEALYLFKPGLAAGAWARVGWQGRTDWGARLRWSF